MEQIKIRTNILEKEHRFETGPNVDNARALRLTWLKMTSACWVLFSRHFPEINTFQIWTLRHREIQSRRELSIVSVLWRLLCTLFAVLTARSCRTIRTKDGATLRVVLYTSYCVISQSTMMLFIVKSLWHFHLKIGYRDNG